MLSTGCLLAFLLLRESYLCRFQLLYYLSLFLLIDFRRNGLAPFLDGALPVGSGHLQTARLLVKIAQMFLDGGIGAHVLRGLGEIVLGYIVLAEFEIGPAE